MSLGNSSYANTLADKSHVSFPGRFTQACLSMLQLLDDYKLFSEPLHEFMKIRITANYMEINRLDLPYLPKISNKPAYCKTTMNRNDPPLILVKTWLNLLKSNEQQEVKDHAARMLLSSFGSLEKVASYCKEKGLSMN